MAFFDELPEPTGEGSGGRYIAPDWSRVPHEVTATVLPLHEVVHRSDRAALLLQDVAVYPTGITFSVVVVRHPELEGDAPMHESFHGGPGGVGGAVRIGMSLDDGRRVTYPMGLAPEGHRGPPKAAIVPSGGGGTTDVASTNFWAWPLPAEGDLTLHFRWRAEGLEETSHVLSGDDLRAAAAACREIWPGARMPPPTDAASGWDAYR